MLVFGPSGTKEKEKCPIVYPGDSREICAFAEPNAWEFYLILACTGVFTLRQRDQTYFCSNLFWEVQHHSQEPEKKTTLITQTCHISNRLSDMPLKAGLPECHGQTRFAGTKQMPFHMSTNGSPIFSESLGSIVPPIPSFLWRLVVKIFFRFRKYSKSFPCW